MPTWQRHRLVWLGDRGWARLLSAADDGSASRDPAAADCLAHWAANDLPLVVTQQPARRSGVDVAGGMIALGLAAPLRWQRRRLRLAAPVADIGRIGDFPTLAEVAAAGDRDADGWAALAAAAAAAGSLLRVHGSVGWQHLSGLACVRDGSDIDLTAAVDSVAQADAVVALLAAAPAGGSRIDGELVCTDGAAVAWREWAAWRAGATRQLLVKRLHGSTLESGWPLRVAA